MTTNRLRTKPIHILRQTVVSARETMRKHAGRDGDKITHDRAKAIYDSTLKELARRAGAK